MLPGDEQLVPYGEDSTLSVVRGVAQASAVSAVTLVWERADAGRRSLAGARLTHQERRSTTYTLKNNASVATEGEAKTAPLYIDHSADPSCGGFAIQTDERAIKQTTAFSRYKVVLAPQEELAFTVEETAVHTSLRRSAAQIKLLLGEEWLVGSGEDVLRLPARAALAAFVNRDERSALLTKVGRELRSVDAVGSAVSERELFDWREAKALPLAVLEKLSGLHGLKAKRLEGQRKAAAASARIAEAFKNQDRLRENIRSMEKVGSNKLTDRYLKDLDKEEDELIQTRRAIARLEEEDALLVREMSAALLELGTQVQRLRDDFRKEESADADFEGEM